MLRFNISNLKYLNKEFDDAKKRKRRSTSSCIKRCAE
jgi:hypothetical protein